MIPSHSHRNAWRLSALFTFVTLIATACKETEITDVPVDVANIEVDPPSLTLEVGEVVQVSAVAKSASGRSLTARAVQWSSSNTAVAEVEQNGTVTARGTGNANITASSGGATKQVPVTVIAPPRIVLTPATVRFDALAGGSDPQPQMVNVTNSGEGSITGLDPRIQYTQGTPNWLSASTINQSSTPAVITLRPAIGGLVPGTYTAVVTVSGTNAVNNPQTLSVTLVVAPSFTLTVQGGGTGSGTVAGNGIDCTITNGAATGTCVQRYAANTAVQLNATAATGSLFSGWSGACTNATGPCQLTMTENRAVTATFAPPTPPTLSNGGYTVLELNAATCSNGGSRITLSFNYQDPNGDVAAGNTVFGTFTLQPSGFNSSLTVNNATFNGTAFGGTISMIRCVAFGSNSLAVYELRLADSAQLVSNTVTISIPKPVGAN